MEEADNNHKLVIVEWIIENFSCWNEEIHDLVIESGMHNTCTKFELRRTFVSGVGEYITIFLRNVLGKKIHGDLCLLGPDGLLLWSKQVNVEPLQPVLEIYPGVGFNYLVKEIRKKELSFGDQLTLRLCYKCRPKNVFVRLCSKLDVRTIFMKIALPSPLVPGKSPNPCRGNSIIRLHWPFDDEHDDVLNLRVREDPFSKVELLFDPYFHGEKVYVYISMSVLDNDQSSAFRTEVNEAVVRKNKMWMFSNSLLREELEPEGVSILLRVRIAPKRKIRHLYNHSSTCPEIVSQIPTGAVFSKTAGVSTTTVLSSDFLGLLEKQDFSDIQLHCEDATFHAHKNVLGARSPVFRSMLTSNMEESVSGVVKIEDLESSTLSRFLHFLYSGHVQDLEWDSAFKLYYAADKYEVPTLRKVCTDFLDAHLSVDNVCDVLILAERHQDARLASVAQLFILKNYSSVLSSSEWERLVQSDPLLTSKTLTFFAKKKFVRSCLNV